MSKVPVTTQVEIGANVRPPIAIAPVPDGTGCLLHVNSILKL